MQGGVDRPLEAGVLQTETIEQRLDDAFDVEEVHLPGIAEATPRFAAAGDDDRCDVGLLR
jgi:hypothetical protein